MYKYSILLVVQSLHIGGLEKTIAHLCNYINKEKFNVSVCCLKELGSIGKTLSENGYSITVLQKTNYFKNNYISWYLLLSWIKKQKVDVLHSHTLDALLDATICRFFTKNIRVIHTFHYGNYPNLPKKYLYMEKFCSRFVDQLVSVGNEQKQKIISALKIRDHAISTVWNGVPTSLDNKSMPGFEEFKNNGKVIIGTVCTLIEQKGLTNLIDVALLLKQKGLKCIFLIAGEGHLRKDLENKVKELGLQDDVIFLGWVEDASVSFIPYIDIFVLPSLWEAMSVVVLEAMAAGKPVVVTDVGENRHVIENGKNGIIVPKMDSKRMAKEIESLILDKDLRQKLGQNARQKVINQYSVHNMVKEYERLYLDILGKR